MQDLLRPDSPLRELPVVTEIEGELCQYPQLTLDQDPAGGGCQAVRGVPGLERGRGRAESLPPEVEHLLVEAETDERPQLHVHLSCGL